MSSIRYRFVGLDELPRSLSASEVQDAFSLTPEDIETIRESRFHRERLLGLALHLVHLRATGCFPSRAAVQPRELLRSLCAQLGLSATAIATLRTIYSGERTVAEHRLWARERCQFRLWNGEQARAALDQAMAVWAQSAPSVGELVHSASTWLFDNRYVHPGDRPVRDRARRAFAEVERVAIDAVKSAVPAQAMTDILNMLSEPSPEDSPTTVLEWLKAMPGKPGPANLGEVADRIDVLKSFGAHEWDLTAITPERLAAFASGVVRRPPNETFRLSHDLLRTEVACFLRHRLLELTDQAIFRVDRRLCDLRRRAYERTEARQASKATTYREALQSVMSAAQDSSRPPQQRLDDIVDLVQQQLKDGPASHAAVVRETLARQSQQIRPLIDRLLDTLDVRGDAQRRSTRLLEALKALRTAGATELPADFDIAVVPRPWQSLVADADRARALQALEACAVMGIREGMRGGQLWVSHSARFRSRTDSLIPLQDWRQNRQALCSALKLPVSAEAFLQVRRANLQVGLAALSEAVDKNAVEIDAKGLVRLPALFALDEDKALKRTRASLSELVGAAQLPDILLQVDARTNFSEILLGRRPGSARELVSVYAALLAHGTEVDAKGVAAMIPGVTPAHVSAAMRAIEAHDRLRKANARVAEFQRDHPLAALWGEASKASADMMSLDASRHLVTARTDPRRRTFAAGIYTHVLSSYGVVYDQPIVLNTRQAAPAVEGVEAYNAADAPQRLRIELLAVDTHGYSYAGMSVAKLLGFDLCPQLARLPERRLLLPSGTAIPANLERLAVEFVSDRRIVAAWDEMLRLVASIRTGRVSVSWALQRLGSFGREEAVQRGFDDLGRWLRSEFLCDYLTNAGFRREIHTLLNRGESVHQLQRAIYYGRVQPERGRRRDELAAISGSHALLTNIVIAWNTVKLQEVVERLSGHGQVIDETLLRHIGPVQFGNINFRGHLNFGVEAFAETLLQRRTPTGARVMGHG